MNIGSWNRIPEPRALGSVKKSVGHRVGRYVKPKCESVAIVGRAQPEDCHSFCEFKSRSDMKVDIADDGYFSNIFVDLEFVFQNLCGLFAFW